MRKEKRFSGRLRIFRTPTLISELVILLLFLGFCSFKSRLFLVDDPTQKSNSLAGTFKLKQIHRHGVGSYYKFHQKLDVTDDFAEEAGILFRSEELKLLSENPDETFWSKNTEFQTTNPFSYEFPLKYQHMSMKRMENRHPDFVEAYINNDIEREEHWIDEDVLVPDVSDRNTVILMALMSSNAYVRLPEKHNWRNISDGDDNWKDVTSPHFGWDGNGLRGHVFVNEVDKIAVISIKGTSATGLPGSEDDETTASDKINDNLLFSCCCARVSYLWTTVCPCYVKSKTCDESCLERELRRKDRYYSIAMDIYRSVVEDYPDYSIWLTGHSLGGALASLVGRTYGSPVLTYETPGDALAARRLHLPHPPGLPNYLEGIWHIGHTADPIYMGTCNGASSACSIAGYAMETACHTGKVCVYDVVKDKGWRVNLLNHKIHTVIDEILTKYDDVPTCGEPSSCIDCYNWKYWPDEDGDHDSTTSRIVTTTSVATSTTRTTVSSTCIGRNWLGFCTEYGPVLPTGSA
ncbi:hypothetical protein KAFR_0F02810 [Kazachstania africana CBS 2517]|uniref:Putative lipase ATG15 n=1 Tax=Kazachstania africana (strain ATCC 22294 / BCRC 22015 / CBS 2517 / CECT 1963 / NBRC 1671 / NRRL Y-8276) TaxID=1071382 RepID=H2AWX8_KAZAF|nr:hypothetical protein KAFR_0F02810 [Kazachstania africana CBS 2517]CCF58878.1 hypothetical protein KAFR_0F02810 [Kazachstania africana CBS 2517]